MDYEREMWLQIFKEYRGLQKLAEDFIRGVGYPKEKYGYPLQGTNWSGLLGDNGSPDCEFIAQIRAALYPK